MNEVLALLLAYKYAVILPLAIIEGPILVVIGGFLVSLGQLNAFALCAIIILGDIIGDTFLYSVGRWGGKFLHRYGARFGVSAERLAQGKSYFHEHHLKTITLSKLAHGIGVIGLIIAGSSKVPYWRYLRTCLFVTLLQTPFLFFVGFLFGHAYLQIGRYLDYYAATIAIIAACVGLFFLYKKLKV